MDRRFRAFDADTGKILWETVLGGIIVTSTITYAVNGRQYVAVMTGDAQSGTAGLLERRQDLQAGARPQRDLRVRAAQPRRAKRCALPPRLARRDID